MTTILVEPNPLGHRFQAVAEVAEVARRSGDVVLLTSKGAGESEWFASFLQNAPITVVERYDSIYPPTREMARGIAEVARGRSASTAVVMDADESLKRWWYAAWLEFRGLPNKPRVVFMLTRYIARLELLDLAGWQLKISKAVLALLAMATGTLHRAAGFAGRDDFATGWVVKRLRDPAVNTAHARDRAELRRKLDLPQDRRIVGIIGAIDARKSVPLLYEATVASGPDADLLVAGSMTDDVAEWVDARTPAELARLVLRRGHLTNDELDQLVAACDVISVVQLNKGPSGIMGKALTAGVPVVTAGSKVRAHELSVTKAGLATDMTAGSVAAALRRLYEWAPGRVNTDALPPATTEAFAETLLGVQPGGRLPGR
ncbi:MAG: hypothetical protein QOJ34_907, partial [Pseudonocardiales bacterium]|nr:hypothetical protein [Pseudonocardiales bacterium]